MVKALYAARVLTLMGVVLFLFVGRYVGAVDDVRTQWKELDFAIRTSLVMFFGWPLIAFTTPVLLDFWEIIADAVIGLGGKYLITDINTILLLLLIAAVAIQTTVLSLRLEYIQEEI